MTMGDRGIAMSCNERSWRSHGLPLLAMELPWMNMDDHDGPWHCHGSPRAVMAVPWGDHGITTDDHGLPRVPKAYP